jgi:hypothetical protein
MARDPAEQPATTATSESPAPNANAAATQPTAQPAILPAAPLAKEASVEITHAIPPSASAPGTVSAAMRSGMPPAPWPTASASVYEELLGYVLLPGDYADRLWAHGYGDIMSTLLAPAAAEGSAPEAARAPETGIVDNGMCSAKASELATGLIRHTAEIVTPTAEQKSALDALGAALNEAIARGRGKVCDNLSGSDPLKRTADALWVMWDATLLLRPPLQKFYDSLDPEQKAKLAGNPTSSRALAQACTAERSIAMPDRVAATLAPEARQRLEALRDQSASLAKYLVLSCPKEIETTPIDRLKAAGGRMNALLYVAMSMSR